MNKLNIFKGLCCSLLLLFSNLAFADWAAVQDDVLISTSRPAFDRVNRVYAVQVTLENQSEQDINGPLRVLIENPSIPVTNASGMDNSDTPYLELDAQHLAAGDSAMVTIQFELQRVKLSFTPTLQSDADTSNWTMVWNDEFEGSNIDETKWGYDLDCNGGGNFEKQCYTDNPENAYIDNGVLKIVAKPESGLPLPYSSARLVTKGKADWTYGRFEIRAKAPTGQGAWPAIWMLPTDEVYGGWPHSGEIDIFEAVNLGAPRSAGSEEIQTDVYGTLHYGKSWPDNDDSGHNYVLANNENPADDFHVYAFEWEEGEMRWYMDGVLYETQRQSEVSYNGDGQPDGLLHKGWYTEVDGEVVWNSAPFDEKFHLILNFAVGGSWPEAVNLGGVDPNAFHVNNSFDIDYVRVYECSVSPVNGQGCATVSAGYDELIPNGGTLQQGDAPIPVPPSDGIAQELTIFEDDINQSWPAWDCCGGLTPNVKQDDSEHGNVVEFSIGSTPAVVGFNTNVSALPDAYDGSPMLGNGVLEFDLKLVNPPNNASAKWNLKVEQAGASTEAVVVIDTPTSQWQHYSIPLRNLAGAGLNLNGIDVVMIFPDWGEGEGAVFRVDNMAFKEGDVLPPGNGLDNRILVDFEQDEASYGFANFEGGVSTLAVNPDKSGINTSDQVAQMQKFAGQPWGGSTFNLAAPIDVDNTLFSIKVWSDRPVNLLFKLEGMDVERSVAHSGTGWEQLTFDFNGEVGAGVSKITVIFDITTLGDAAGDPDNWTFYYDDVGVFEEPDVKIVDFEQAAGSYSFTNFDGGVSTVISNPHNGGINASAQVVQMQKFAAQIWGGSTLTLPESIDVDGTLFTMKVWSDRAVNVLFKLEGMNVERNVAHSGSGWEELSFDFGGDVGSGVTQVTVIFDLGTNGDAAGDPDNWTFYYDDISYPSSEEDPVVVDPDPDPANFSVDFESAVDSYTFANFDGGVAYVIANPQSNSDNSSSQVALMQKFAGAPWGGATLTLPTPVAVDSTVFSMKVWSSRAADVLFKLEGMDSEQNVAHGGTGWETLTFDFTGKVGSLTQITLIFDLGITGNADEDPANWTFYFDDIQSVNESATDIDSDDDGIADSVDACPDTPAGAAVDASGCTIVVSIDSDGDGIDDNNDQCADTPTGTVVDGLGCPLSSDSVTGIVQDSDSSVYFYVNTSGWADVHYSINGAGQQNVRMQIVGARNTFALSGLADGDEIDFWFTYLPNEGNVLDSPHEVYVVGGGSVADEDNDGVSDGQDQCPGTAQGGEVDAVGCPVVVIDDEDGDGIADEFDQCPGTEAGVMVDAVGCAVPVYGDEDNDGVTDNLDQCLGTEAGVPVDAFGCEVVPAVHEVSSANNILVGGSGSEHNGLTLYVFDNDNGTDGSVCNAGCQENWPPLLVTDGTASGIAGLSTIIRDDGSIQATHQGRPLYFYAGDSAAGDTAGEGLGGVWWTVEYAAGVGDVIPLFHENTLLEQDISYDRGDALITRFADRGRDRHAKEDQFQIYDHYLSHYWTHRTARFQFEDYVAKGGETVDVTFISEWKLGAREFRVWYRGLNTVAEYHGNLQTDSQWPVTEEGPGTWDNNFNKISDSGVQYKYTTKITKYQGLNWQPTDPIVPLAIGQKMEIEVSQFLDGQPEGRANYYGTTYLYVIGQGMVPWKTVGDFNDKSSEREDSYPIATQGWLGGKTTLPYNYTNEPDNHFMQMATNLSHVNGQPFVLGRRLFHTDFDNGQHDESPENGVFDEMVGKAGNHYINASCAGCHERNGRAAPVAEGLPLDKWVFQVGDANGDPDPLIGRILQPQSSGIGDEGSVSIDFWTEESGLRSPNYQFSQATPATFSARIAPQLVGIGLLEAIPESSILAMEDVNDLDNDGISGKAQRSIDPVTGDTRLGRFGWKAAKVSIRHQIAAALNTDIGVTTSVLPDPDCGSEQDTCGSSGTELNDQHLEDLVKYTALLGVRAQRDLDDPQVQQGKQLFSEIGCAGCHTPTLQTSEYHPFAELRNQTIHPYTDMLLHDMGPGLADNLGEEQATGAEWRTTPLWGIGLSACVTGGVINPIGGQGNEVCTPEHSYLHDGRARSIEEAILWHGGESESSMNNYQSLSANEKDAMLSFLNSL